MNDSILTLTHATERDVDLILVEELNSSQEFVRWLSDRAGAQGSFERWSVLHSKRRTQSRREIDICLILMPKTGRTKRIIFIENKLDTLPQPDQAESYRDECRVVVANGTASFAVSILVCPEAYVSSQRGFAEAFDAVVSYESVREALDQRANTLAVRNPELATRLRFRAKLIEQAITKSRRGYEAVPLARIGTFNSRYIALLNQLAPDILPGPSMLKPANPAESVSMIFDHQKSLADLPGHLRPRRFAHEFGRGQAHRANYVAVAFPAWGRTFGEHRERLLRDLTGTPYKLASSSPTKMRPNPALKLIIETPAVDNQNEFDSQQDLIEQGIRAAVSLRRWLLGNQPLLKRWHGLLVSEGE